MMKFEVQGMTCGGCSRAVTNAVQRAAPEAVVEVDLPTKTVSVTSNATAEQIEQVIERAGYEASLLR